MYFRKIEFHFNYKSSISNVKIKHKPCKSFPIWLIEKNFQCRQLELKFFS